MYILYPMNIIQTHISSQPPGMVSILMPIYNGIEFIEESVSSVLKQTVDHWELLIGINGHAENSAVYHIAKSYELVSDKIRVFDLHKIRGKPDALNELVKHAIYKHIALLDVDDIWSHMKLEKQIPYIIEGYDVVGSRCVYFGEERFNGIIPNTPVGDISTIDFFAGNPIINSSVIIRREHAYWENEVLEDYDLWLSLRRDKRRFFNCSQVLVKHRIHAESAFNSKGNANHVPRLLQKYI